MIDDFKRVESHDSDVHLRRPCGLPCRTATGKAAIQHHTARFRLMPQLAKKLSVPTGAKKRLYPSPATIMRMLRERDEQAVISTSA